MGEIYLNAMLQIRIRNLFGPWIRDGKNRIRDKHSGSTTLPLFEKQISAIEGRTVSLTVDVMHKYTVHWVPVMFSPRVHR
jgi:hypothetical protein